MTGIDDTDLVAALYALIGQFEKLRDGDTIDTQNIQHVLAVLRAAAAELSVPAPRLGGGS